MKKIMIGLVISLYSLSFAGERIFPDMENTVGYIIDNKGNKYLIVENINGAKLIKVNKKPNALMNKSLGISKEEFNLTGEGK